MFNQVHFRPQEVIEDFPDAYCCDINFKLMENPTVTRCGHTFEHSSIIDSIKKFKRCPIDNTPLKKRQIVTNYKFKEVIDGFRNSLVTINLYTHYGSKVKVVLSVDSTIQRIKELACEHGVLQEEQVTAEGASMGYRLAHRGNPLSDYNTLKSLGAIPGQTLTCHVIKVFAEQ